MNCPAPSLRPHYRALTATTGRSAPVSRIGTLALAVFAACSPSRGQKHRPSLSVATGSPVPCQRLRRAHATYTPGTAGATYRQLPDRGPTGLSRDHPQIPVSMPSLFRFDASAVVHTCSSSHRTPAPLTARRHPQRSPPRLLTDAACGGLESPPARRPRRTYPHHWHSTDRADDLLHHHHHFPSGHTWVPMCRWWSGGISVLVDESATAGRSNDLEVPIWLVCSVGGDGWSLIERTVGPVRVVVIDVVDDKPVELATVPDDAAVEELASRVPIQRSANAFATGVAYRCLEELHTFGSEDLVEGVDELAGPVAHERPGVGELVAVTQQQVPSRLGGRRRRWGGP